MFLRKNTLKKFIKEAYKGPGLRVSKTEHRWMVYGAYWGFDVRNEYMPKEILGEILTLTGELPGVGEGFKATKDQIQYELEIAELDARQYERNVEETKIIILGDKPQRILQETNGKIHLMNNALFEMVDKLEIDKQNGEYFPDAIFCNENAAMWQNNVMRFTAIFRKDEAHERILEELEVLDLTEDTPK